MDTNTTAAAILFEGFEFEAARSIRTDDLVVFSSPAFGQVGGRVLEFPYSGSDLYALVRFTGLDTTHPMHGFEMPVEVEKLAAAI